ncbi:hypothetical protein QJQ45_002282 [Haematococcus lacustris]|nr:hypothetical protein QJQ45_002282 [Haematococcus lacustris]
MSDCSFCNVILYLWSRRLDTSRDGGCITYGRAWYSQGCGAGPSQAFRGPKEPWYKVLFNEAPGNEGVYECDAWGTKDIRAGQNINHLLAHLSRASAKTDDNKTDDKSSWRRSVEVPEFKDFIIPTRKKMGGELLLNEYAATCDEVRARIDMAPYVSITCDAWSPSQGGEHIQGWCVAWLGHAFMLDAVHTEDASVTAFFMKEKLDLILDKHNLKGKVSALVTDTPSTMKTFWALVQAAYPKTKASGCWMHITNLTFNGKALPTLGHTRSQHQLTHHSTTLPRMAITEWTTIAYTDGSCIKTSEPDPARVGAGVYIPESNALLTIAMNDPENNTINKAELTAIHAALKAGARRIATDSLCSLYQIRRALANPMSLINHRHNDILTDIATLIIDSPVTTQFYKVRAHSGIIGNEGADALAKHAALHPEQANTLEYHPTTPKERGIWLNNGTDGENLAPLPDCRHSVRAHMHSKHKLGLANQDSIYYQMTQDITKAAAKGAGERVMTDATISTPAQRTALLYRTGGLYNQKLAMRWKQATDDRCPLCGEADSATHLLSGCSETLPLVQERHNGAGRLIAKAISKGTLGGCIRFADTGSWEKGARENLDLPNDTLHTTLRALGMKPTATKNTTRPDIIMVTPQKKTGKRGKATKRITIIEIKYCADSRWMEQLDKALNQHTKLAHTMRKIGHMVEIRPILLGIGGITYETHTRQHLIALGITQTNATKLLHKLTRHAQRKDSGSKQKLQPPSNTRMHSLATMLDSIAANRQPLVNLALDEASPFNTLPMGTSQGQRKHVAGIKAHFLDESWWAYNRYLRTAMQPLVKLHEDLQSDSANLADVCSSLLIILRHFLPELMRQVGELTLLTGSLRQQFEHFVTTQPVATPASTPLEHSGQSAPPAPPAATSAPLPFRPPPPPSFCGTPNADAGQWLWRIDNHFDLFAMPAQQRLLAVASYLDGAALTWYRSLLSSQALSSWDSFKASFTRQFTPVNQQRHARDQLAACHQITSARQYIMEFSNLCLLISDLSPAEKLDRFLRGLKPAVRRELELREPTSFEEAAAMADRVDAITFGSRPRLLKLPEPEPVAAMELDALQLAQPLGSSKSPGQSTPAAESSPCPSAPVGSGSPCHSSSPSLPEPLVMLSLSVDSKPLILHGTFSGHRARFLLDSGATGNIVSSRFLQQVGLRMAGILNQMRKDYESSPADGMSYSTLRQVHAVLAINYKKRILQRPHVGHPSNLIDDALYKQAYKNLLYVVNGCGKRKEGVESQDQCPAGGITRIQLAEVSLHLVKVPGLSPAFLRSAFTCMWAGISRFDDICQLLLQDLRPPTLLPTVGPLPCYQYGFLFIGGKTNTPNVKRYQSFTRAMNWVVCPVNAIGHFLWYKYVFANWDMPHPDKTKGERDPWLTEAFFCVNKTHRDKAASWQAVADQFKKLKTLFDILIDRVLHSFRKGASYDLYSQGVHLDLIRIVGNWLAPDSMTQAYTTGPSPVVLVQHGDWPEIDNNYLKGYFHERMLIKVPSTAIQGLFPFLKGYEDAACKKRTGHPPARLVAQAMTSIGEVVLQDFIHQTAADQLEGTPPNLTSPLAMHMWSLPEVPVLVNIHINNLKTKAFEHKRPHGVHDELLVIRDTLAGLPNALMGMVMGNPTQTPSQLGTLPPQLLSTLLPSLLEGMLPSLLERVLPTLLNRGTQPPAPQHPGLQGTQPPAPQHPGLQGTQPWSPVLQGTQPPAPQHPGLQGTQPWSPALQGTQPWSPVLQGTQPPAPQHPGLQGTQPPAPQHPGLQGTQPPAPQHPGLQGTQPWSPVLQGTQPPAPQHPGLQGTQPWSPVLQGTQPPAPQHPGLHGTQPPAPQHPGLPSTQAATASKKQKGSYEWLKHNCSFADMRREWHQGQQGVRPPLKVLDAQPGRPYRVGMGKTFTGQIESFKDGVFGLEVVLEVEGLTVEQVQQQANKQWEEDAARAAKGPNRHRVGRQWSGHVKWLEATFPNCFLAGRLMKKDPTLSAAMAYAKVKQPTEVLPTPSRALKKARVEAGLQSPNAASVRRALQFGESPGAGCDVAACADNVIKHLQEME